MARPLHLGPKPVPHPLADHRAEALPRCVATDIALLLERGRSQGPAAGLRQKFEYLWRSCSGVITAQSDLFRLTYATEVLKDDVWGSRGGEYKCVAHRGGTRRRTGERILGRKRGAEYCLYRRRYPAVIGSLWEKGDIAPFIRTMADYGLQASATDSTPLYHTVTLKPATGDR
ncbi:hypothetical protein [Enterobacter bugandensis]